MKTSLITLAGSLLCLVTNLALADCAYPKAPEKMPDPSSATQSEMVEAMRAFKQYNTEVDNYVTCLDEETVTKVKDADGPSLIMQIKAIQSKKRSSAMDERQGKIEAFNKAVREFKAKSAG